MNSPRILIVGTVDTKSDEIGFMAEQVAAAGGQALVMDVGVLAKGRIQPDIANTEVAAAAGVTLQQVMDSGDENSAMAFRHALALPAEQYWSKLESLLAEIRSGKTGDKGGYGDSMMMGGGGGEVAQAAPAVGGLREAVAAALEAGRKYISVASKILGEVA